MPEPTVRPGQIWADNDKRAAGRTIRVDRVDARYAYVVAVSGRFHRPYPDETRARRSRILLDRFRPTGAGYRLIQEAPGA